MRATTEFFVKKEYLGVTRSLPKLGSILLTSTSGLFTFGKVFPSTYLAYKFGSQYDIGLGILLGLGTAIPLIGLGWHTNRQQLMALEKCATVKGTGITLLLTAINFFPSVYSYYISSRYSREFLEEVIPESFAAKNKTVEIAPKIMGSLGFISTLLTANWSVLRLWDMTLTNYYHWRYDQYQYTRSQLDRLKKVISNKELYPDQKLQELIVSFSDGNYEDKFRDAYSIANNIANNEGSKCGVIPFVSGVILGGICPLVMFVVTKTALTAQEFGFKMPESLTYIFSSWTLVTLAANKAYGTYDSVNKLLSCSTGDLTNCSWQNLVGVGIKILLAGISMFYRVQLVLDYPILSSKKDDDSIKIVKSSFDIFSATAATFFTDYWAMGKLFRIVNEICGSGKDERDELLRVISKISNELLHKISNDLSNKELLWTDLLPCYNSQDALHLLPNYSEDEPNLFTGADEERFVNSFVGEFKTTSDKPIVFHNREDHEG